MPTIKATVNIEIDGIQQKGFPMVRRLSLDESQTFDVTRATGGGYVALPTAEMADVRVLFVNTDAATTLRLDGQSDAGIVINADGLVLIFNATIDAGASTNATLDNSSGGDAQVRGLAAGT